MLRPGEGGEGEGEDVAVIMAMGEGKDDGAAVLHLMRGAVRDCFLPMTFFETIFSYD